MNRIRELRKEKNVTLKEVADTVGVAPSQLSFYESEKRTPRNKDTWMILADYFGVTPEYLLGYSDIRTNEDKKHLEALLDFSDVGYLVDDMPDDEFDYRKAVYETKLTHLKVLEKKDAEKARLIDEMLILAENELSIDELRMFVDQMGGYLLKKRKK
ncbi:helix-turn-helix domain-containing protein [Enterococcus cecorum]|uniref:helix-turn-helix domain-containing protein n=1 Tax=Enterococcus cecorum TaxID=44008 RepID=UPI000A98E3B9|nr:helix-turn-helix transcriptional regulator [Enterococcus cecorum]MCJ0534653.1 helix-turn-helix domain-containing protein [Enterococcus cecorum]MCJ0556303.1 helix-turn-helix domain-containing protein [Enterococcus cecorum]MDZ5546676.1 helix-turn-helix transcriptional regulator [Enterococcus cecorum]MDZ5581848.1 helix-turn-helix transcriptional regulator [Enterococcus cecorum]MDZ5592628.1 helix-turn-helix transcriptional regulator [Enterococcus cecorum]